MIGGTGILIKKDSIQYDEDDFNGKEDLISSDDDYEDDRPDFNSQTQLHITFAGAKVLNREGNELQNLDPEKKYHNFRYACEEKTCRCFTNKTTGTKINITTRQHYYSLATSNRL
jgi:hypothetical protein